MIDWNPERYGATVTRLVAEPRLNELGPGASNASAYDLLAAIEPAALGAGRPLKNRAMAEALCAALWLLHDYLDESHRISQSLDTLEGSYWHGIMHRREPDFGNAHYWMRRVPTHPTHPSLLIAGQQLLSEAAPENGNRGGSGAAADDAALRPARELLRRPTWSSAAFVDLCESALGGPAPLESLTRRIQQAEWRLLFDYCYSEAFGGAPSA